ncbi:MAG: c-type cytochrome [Mariniblastus sp.]|nr:c-type cytochrome [Mariniblastus sp.]
MHFIRSISSVAFVGFLWATGSLFLSVPSTQLAWGQDSLDRDYGDQLQRISPRTPASAAETIELNAGLKIELMASEPMVADPVAITFDPWGRAYVVEMRGYSEREEQLLGRIKRLEDTNGDGRFNKSVIYADQFRWPTAIVCVAGGILVGDAPDIIFLADRDKDGRADFRQVIFTGLGTSNVQQLPNNLQWGIDNHIYGASGGNGGRLRRVESAGDSPLGTQPWLPFQPVDVRGRDFKINPITLKLESIAGGTQFGMTFDRWGTRYVCSNSDHCQQIIFEEQYAARNRQQKSVRSRVSIAIEGAAAEVFRSSPVEPWRKVRTRLRVQGLVRGPIEGGGRAAGYFTSATGICCYDGDLLPRQYAGDLFVGDVGSNLVHRKKITGDGIQKQASRTEFQTEFIRSTDNWFRPVQMANSPDGSLVVLDMYRETIEHPASLPPLIKQHLDLNSGNRRGRIYRVVPASHPSAQNKRQLPGDATLPQLVQMLGHANGWHRKTSARLLLEKSSDMAVSRIIADLIRKHGLTSPVPKARIRSLYLLSNLKALHQEELALLLHDKHPQVRIHTIRITESYSDWNFDNQIIEMSNDVDPEVRFQVALTLGECDSETANAIAQLAAADGSSPWMQIALASSAHRDRGLVIQKLVELSFSKQGPALENAFNGCRELLLELTDQLVRQPTRQDLEIICEIMDRWDDAHHPILRGEFVSRLIKLPETEMQFLRSTLLQQGISLQQVMEKTTLEAKKVALNQALDTPERVIAIAMLRMLKPETIGQSIQQLLELNQAPEIKQAAIDLASNFDTLEMGEAILGRFKELSPATRSKALQVLLTRESWTRQLMRKLSTGEIPPVLVDAAVRQRIVRHRNADIQAQAKQVFGSPADADRKSLVQRYLSEVDPALGNLDRGRQLFRKSCVACHRLENEGQEIGPNLAAFANRGAAAMITNILDPNREVDPRFLSYQIQLRDGRNLLGVISNETAATLALRNSEGKTVTILRDEIDAMQSTRLSLMPENFEKEINPQAMADLLKYLLSQGG